MKKQLLSFCFICSTLILAQAQSSVVFETNPLNASGSTTAALIEGINRVKNVGTDTLKLAWKTVVIATQPSWQFSVCDVNQCWSPAVVGKNFSLAPGESARMNVDLTPNGKKGVGQVELRLSLQSSPNTVIATGIYNYIIDVTANNDVEAVRVSVYPNPATEFIRLNDPTNSVAKISVMNVLGREIKLFYSNDDDSYNVSDLPAGIYLLRLSDRNNRVIKTLRITTKQP